MKQFYLIKQWGKERSIISPIKLKSGFVEEGNHLIMNNTKIVELEEHGTKFISLV